MGPAAAASICRGRTAFVLRAWEAGLRPSPTYHLGEARYVPAAARHLAAMDWKPTYWSTPPFFTYRVALRDWALQAVASPAGLTEEPAALFARVRALRYLVEWSSGLSGAPSR